MKPRGYTQSCVKFSQQVNNICSIYNMKLLDLRVAFVSVLSGPQNNMKNPGIHVKKRNISYS